MRKRKCPKCQKEISGYPAMSRMSKQMICTPCSQLEALYCAKLVGTLDYKNSEQAVSDYFTRTKIIELLKPFR